MTSSLNVPGTIEQDLYQRNRVIEENDDVIDTVQNSQVGDRGGEILSPLRLSRSNSRPTIMAMNRQGSGLKKSNMMGEVVE